MTVSYVLSVEHLVCKLTHLYEPSLSLSLPQVQLLHATQGAGCEVGDCRATERLCARFEEVLRHGLRASWFGQSSFWPAVLKISRKQAIKHINR